VTFRQSFEREFRDRLLFLADLGLADTAPLERAGPDGAGIVPRNVLLALAGRSGPPVPVGKPFRYEVLRAVVVGSERGTRVTVTADCHADERSGGGVGPDIDTGAPPSIAVQLMMAGELDIRPGVWAPEQVVPVSPFVRELRRRGMTVTRRRASGPPRFARPRA
jgi:saccharopine dehydrogenase-like NADP-dependent oxidoreductase